MTGKTLRIHVDPDKCQGHNRCKALAPELFDLDEFGNASAAGDGDCDDDAFATATLVVAWLWEAAHG